MKFRSLLFCLALLCACLASVAQAQPSPVYADLQATSVLVNVGDGLGTGVLVTKQVGEVTRTFVWTAGHVVIELMRPDGTFRNPKICQEYRENGRLVGKSEVEAKVIAYSDPEAGEDLALLEVLEDNFRPLTVSARFDLDGDILPIGTELIHVGCTLGLYNSTSLGIVSQTDRDLLKSGKFFDQTTCMCYPGSSGGGIYLTDGTYIGMLTRGAGAGLNFIVPMRRILPWAEKMGVMWALDPKLAVPSAAERAELKLTDGSAKMAVENIISDGEDEPAGDEEIPSLPPGGPESNDEAVIRTYSTVAASYRLHGRTEAFFRRSV